MLHLLEEDLAARALFLLVVLSLGKGDLVRRRWFHLGAMWMVIAIERLPTLIGWQTQRINPRFPSSEQRTKLCNQLIAGGGY